MAFNFFSRGAGVKADGLINDKDDLLQEEISGLAVDDLREIKRADTEAKVVVDQAKRTDLKNAMIMDQGRCPQCHSRTETFLLTRVCTNCGWFRTTNSDRGEIQVSLMSGETITCDYVHRGEDLLLCLREGVMVAEINNSQIHRIDHNYSEEDLSYLRNNMRRLSGSCSWCERNLEEGDEEGPYIDLVAFGMLQERYVFCSEKCQKAFRRQYRARVHRNCYERDCASCNECIKRYDSQGIKRNLIK
jgi:hypothetical protein